MEFYCGFSPFRRYFWRVSIPNGMEFYRNPKPARSKKAVSIPNGMEFYFRPRLDTPCLPRVSTPNGMEFYSFRRYPKNHLREFQLPTGWNSTLIQHLLRYEIFKVSTPNGMEFYCFGSSRLASQVESFNSQRDGILLEYCSRGSIYPFGFNSQRDGILHLPAFVLVSSLRFQLPTGWNSTLIQHLLRYEIFKVSTPNGMEFYDLGLCLGTTVFWVSTPNGMEFYLALRQMQKSKALVSTPNGMEFYSASGKKYHKNKNVSTPNGMEFY